MTARLVVAIAAAEAAGAAAFAWALWQQTGRVEYAVSRAFLLAVGLGLSDLGLLTWARGGQQRDRRPATALRVIGTIMLAIAGLFSVLLIVLSWRNQ